MDTVLLNNGVEMPLVGLGTWNLRGEKCTQTVVLALRLGYRLIDTAQMYGNEIEVGRGIVKSGLARREVFITTKLDRRSNSYATAKEWIDISLHKLGVTYVDLLLVHEPYPQGPEIYRALEDALREGLTRSIGLSNYNAQQYTTFLGQCDIVPAVNQCEAHVYFQKWGLQTVLQENNTHFQAWSPLAQGIEEVAKHPLLANIGRKYGKSAAQIALCFLIQRGISVIPKSCHKSRLLENLNLFDCTLTEDDLQVIKKLDQHKTLFPWTEAY